MKNALRKNDLYVHWHCSSLSQLWPKTIWASSLVWTFLWVDLANSTLLMLQNVGQTLTFRNSEKDRRKKIFVKYLGQMHHPSDVHQMHGSLNSGRLKVLLKDCLLTVPNNSYRFWAVLPLEGYVLNMAVIHKYWSKCWITEWIFDSIPLWKKYEI